MADAGEEEACRSAVACAVLPPADERRLWWPAAAATMAAAADELDADAAADWARPAATLLLLTAR